MGIMSSKSADENGNGISAKRSKLYNSKATVVLGTIQFFAFIPGYEEI